MDLYEELLGLVDMLERRGIEYAICGGIALAIHGYPRFTKDIDLLVRPEDLARVQKAVAEIEFTVEGGRIPFDLGKPNERIVHRISKVAGRGVLTLDLLLVSKLQEDVWRGRMVIEWEGRKVQVVSRQGLASMKRVAGREQDILDLKKLEDSGDGGEETPAGPRR